MTSKPPICLSFRKEEDFFPFSSWEITFHVEVPPGGSKPSNVACPCLCLHRPWIYEATKVRLNFCQAKVKMRTINMGMRISPLSRIKSNIVMQLRMVYFQSYYCGKNKNNKNFFPSFQRNDG